MNGTPSSHGAASPSASIERWAKSGPKTTGPQIAPVTAPNSTNDMPRARRSGGNISAAAARERSAIDAAPPTSASPRQTRAADGAADEAAADHRHSPDPVHQAPRGADSERAGCQEDRGAEPEDARHSGDR